MITESFSGLVISANPDLTRASCALVSGMHNDAQPGKVMLQRDTKRHNLTGYATLIGVPSTICYHNYQFFLNYKLKLLYNCCEVVLIGPTVADCMGIHWVILGSVIIKNAYIKY